MDKELSNLLAQKRAGADNIEQITESIHAQADNGFNVQDLKDSDIMKVLNGAYLAKRFFCKSTGWFSQKINHHLKNGKPCDFTPKERETLKRALNTIAWEIQELADNM